MLIPTRCFHHPDEFPKLIPSTGFAGTWGGCTGEAYGEGIELVVEFGR